MRLVSGARFDAVKARTEQLVEERETAEKLAAERLSTITRQAAEITRLRDQRPDAPVAVPRPQQGDPDLRRQLDLARRAVASLEAQCRGLQDSHEADTRELHDLRQGATS